MHLKVVSFSRVLFTALLGLLFLWCEPVFAQTTTNYTYDAKGRLVTSTTSSGNTSSYTYDDANNIIQKNSSSGGNGGNGGNNNNPPTCSNITDGTSQSYFYLNGTLSCSDPDGDNLTVTSVTNPPGSASATISGSQIQISGLICSDSATTTRTVSDGNGGTVTSTVTVFRFGCGGGPLF